jgi:malate synthase
LLDEEGNLPVEKETPKAEEKAQIKQELEELKFNLDPDIVGSDVKSAIDKITSVLNEQRKGLSEERTKLQSEVDSAYNARIDGHFDRLSKQMPDLGSSQNMTRKAADLRGDIFTVAAAISMRKNLPIERAEGQTGDS